MLNVIDRPRQLIRATDGTIHYMAYLFGSLSVISVLARNRFNDALCRQSPNENFSPSYHVRVRYAIATDGEVEIQIIWAAFKPDHWTCVYDSDLGKIGVTLSDNKASRSYYLDGDEEVRHIIFEYEQKRALRRLTRRGPKVFAKRRVD